MSDTALSRSLGDIPTELLFKIVGFLPLKEKLRLEQTSKQFHSITTSAFLENIGLKLEIFGENIIEHSKDEETLIHDPKHLTLALHDKNGGTCSTKAHLDFVKEILSRLRNSIDDIDIKIPISCWQDVHRLLEILKRMGVGEFQIENLRSLKFASFEWTKDSCQCLAGILFGTRQTERKNLKLEILDFGETSIGQEMDGTNVLERCPNLKKLRIGFLYCDEIMQSRLMDALWFPQNIETLAFSHLDEEELKTRRFYHKILALEKSIKQLSLTRCFIWDSPVSHFLPQLTNLTFLNLSDSIFPEEHGLESLKCLPLQRMYIDYNISGYQPLNFSAGRPITAWTSSDSNMRSTLEVLSLQRLRDIPRCELQSIAKFEKLRALNLHCAGEEATPCALGALFEGCLTLECLRVRWEHNLDYYAYLAEGCPALTLLDLVLTPDDSDVVLVYLVL